MLPAGFSTPTYDASGNLTKDETGRTFEFDAWNRLVRAKNSGGTTIAESKYDALSRRVSETKSGVTTDLYYSASWQVLEERVGGNATVQYTWSPVYVDALILRDRDTDANGSLDERLWVQQDANWNVTALVNGSGVVVERYAYDAFGNFTVYDASWTPRGGGSAYGWLHYHQGLRYDATVSLYDNRWRWYDADLGRFASNDSLRFAAGDVNLYRYVGNSPTMWVDTFGQTKGGAQNIRPSFVSGSETVQELEELLAQALRNGEKGKATQLRGWIKVVKAAGKYANKFGKSKGGKPPRVGGISSEALAAGGITMIIISGVAIYYNNSVEECGERAIAKVNRLMLGRLIRVTLHNNEIPEVYDEFGKVLSTTFYIIWRGQLLKVYLERKRRDGDTYYITVYHYDEENRKVDVIIPYGEIPLSGG